MNFPTSSAERRIDLRERHLTGSPVTVLPMTRRWISEVPSKMVKISASKISTLASRVYAGKCGCSSAALGRERTDSTPDGRFVLPKCSQVHPLLPRQEMAP